MKKEGNKPVCQFRTDWPWRARRLPRLFYLRVSAAAPWLGLRKPMYDECNDNESDDAKEPRVDLPSVFLPNTDRGQFTVKLVPNFRTTRTEAVDFNQVESVLVIVVG